MARQRLQAGAVLDVEGIARRPVWLERRQERGEWWELRPQGKKVGEGCQQITSGLVGHREDFGFYSGKGESHGRVPSKEGTLSNLCHPGSV